MRLDGTSVWIVGASSGIGAALARELLGRGCQVAISARDEAALRDVSGGRMLVVPLDVTDAPSVASAAHEVAEVLGRVDVVVLAAGYWQQMSARDFDAAEFRRHVDVNLVGMATCLGEVIPLMLRQGGGTIVGVASVAGFRGLPGAEGYGATKAAQINLLEALRTGLRHDGISVQTVCPGFVRTPMTEGNDFPMPFLVTAEAAARSMADGIESGRPEVVFPWPMAVLMRAARIVPRRLWPLLAGGRRRGR
jgi:NAD(P)-dependent dehydrogenase (short-subunit alcohol dehydrogenase family)